KARIIHEYSWKTVDITTKRYLELNTWISIFTWREPMKVERVTDEATGEDAFRLEDKVTLKLDHLTPRPSNLTAARLKLALWAGYLNRDTEERRRVVRQLAGS